MQYSDDILAAPDQQRDFSAPLGATQAGQLIFTRGVSLITIGCATALGELYRAHFEGPRPKVRTRDGVVAIQYQHFSLVDWAKYALLWSRHTAQITLNASIPWRIEIRGGVSQLTADLRELRLSAFEVRGGASDITVLLPPPSGVVELSVRGGASNISVQRPADAAVGVRVGGGASKLTFDAQHYGGIGGDIRLATPGHERATDRYDIQISGGASKLTVTSF